MNARLSAAPRSVPAPLSVQAHRRTHPQESLGTPWTVTSDVPTDGEPEEADGAAMGEPLEDRRDVFLACGGDRRAFDRLVERHHQAVVDWALYTVDDEQDALEVAQEAFFKAWRSLRGFRGDASFRTWVLRIAVNSARSLQSMRRAKKRSGPCQDVRLDSEPGSGGTRLELADQRSEPSRLLMRSELKRALEEAIGGLDPVQRNVVVLRDIVGEPYDAIAESTGLPVGTVKSKVHRARLALRHRLAAWV